MTTTMTERYIAATVKTLPPEVQDDVWAELEASITDAVEARVEQGDVRADAERAVLTELGDPAVLAAGYADRPLHLIGPRYYLTWWRLLKLLLTIVPICAVGGVILAQTLADASIGAVIGQAVVVAMSVVVHVFFWVTLVFVILERSGADTGVRWDVDQLREPAPTGVGRSDLIGSLVFLGLAVGALLWDRWRGFVVVNDDALPILNPGLWGWPIVGLFAIIAMKAAMAVLIYARGRWSTATAVANTVLAVLFAVWAMTLLTSGQLIGPEFLGVAGNNHVNADTLHTLAVLLGFGIVGFSVWDIVDGWLKRRRDARRMTSAD